MEQVELKVKAGHSRNGTTAMHVVGTLFGSKTSATKLKSSILANNRRNYTRYKTVWQCANGCGESYREEPRVIESIVSIATKLTKEDDSTKEESNFILKCMNAMAYFIGWSIMLIIFFTAVKGCVDGGIA